MTFIPLKFPFFFFSLFEYKAAAVAAALSTIDMDSGTKDLRKEERDIRPGRAELLKCSQRRFSSAAELIQKFYNWSKEEERESRFALQLARDLLR